MNEKRSGRKNSRDGSGGGEGAENRGPWRHAKKSKAGANGDKFCDERQEIADSEIDHREPAPERPKSVENQFGMAAMRGGAETHGHFLNDDRHNEGEHNKRDKESDAIA